MEKNMVCKSISLAPFTPPQSHGLAVFLEFGDQGITVLHHIRVLLVLVVGTVGLDDALAGDAVNGARDAAGSDESSQIAKIKTLITNIQRM